MLTPLLLSTVAALTGSPVVRAEEAVLQAPSVSNSKLKELSDPILAYRFDYPIETVSGKPLRMVLAHEPEKYSSAAPLTADARQRIVSELIDLRSFVTVSMTVGPAAGVLKGRPVSEWRPMDVALTVLIDRSTSRVSNGQRVALNDVEEAKLEERDGGSYFLYEHLSQGSPTLLEQTKETFRHALAATTTRPGLDGSPYLYTLNLSCRQDMWDDLEPLFRQSLSSFRLLPTTNSFISPDKDPWLFF